MPAPSRDKLNSSWWRGPKPGVESGPEISAANSKLNTTMSDAGSNSFGSRSSLNVNSTTASKGRSSGARPNNTSSKCTVDTQPGGAFARWVASFLLACRGSVAAPSWEYGYIPTYMYDSGYSYSSSIANNQPEAHLPLPTDFEVINDWFQFNQSDVNEMVTSIFAEDYAAGLLQWCHCCVDYANAHRIWIDGITHREVSHLWGKFTRMDQAWSPDRSPIIDALSVIKRYAVIFDSRTPLRAIPAEVPGLLAFCAQVQNNRGSLTHSEFEAWNDVVMWQTGMSISEFVLYHGLLRR